MDTTPRPVVVLDPGRTFTDSERELRDCEHWRVDHVRGWQCEGCDCPRFGRPDPAAERARGGETP